MDIPIAREAIIHKLEAIWCIARQAFSESLMTLYQRHLVSALFVFLIGTAGLFCQKQSSEENDTIFSAGEERILPLDTENNVQQRFVAVHGRRSLVDGYASNGLEIWAYPF